MTWQAVLSQRAVLQVEGTLLQTSCEWGHLLHWLQHRNCLDVSPDTRNPTSSSQVAHVLAMLQRWSYEYDPEAPEDDEENASGSPSGSR